MKKLLALAFCSFVSITAFAAAPAITVSDLSNIRIGGVNAGCLEDVIANYPSRATEVRAAVKAHVEAAPATALIVRAEAKSVVISAEAKAKAAAADAEKAAVESAAKAPAK